MAHLLSICTVGEPLCISLKIHQNKLEIFCCVSLDELGFGVHFFRVNGARCKQNCKNAKKGS